jgi:hypothetical protein
VVARLCRCSADTEWVSTSKESNSSHHDEKHNYSSGDKPAVLDLEAAKWQARENGYEEEDTEDSLYMQKIKAMLHSRQAVYVRDFGLIALLLGWWIPAIVNDSPRVRHRWIPSTVIVSVTL